MRLYATIIDAPVGKLFVAVDDDGALCRLEFAQSDRECAPKNAELAWDAERCAEVVRQLDQYFRGERRAFELPLALDGSEFQRRVWNELLKIPYGETVSYGEIAARIGNPKAVRAVGLANGSNHIAIVVPCHRVIGANGSLTGYGGGLPIKTKLLELERSQRSLFA